MIEKLKAELLSSAETREHYDTLVAEFDAAKVLIALRQKLEMTQKDLATKAGISQPQLARLESGRHSPRLITLAKIAASVGYRLEISLVPIESDLRV